MSNNSHTISPSVQRSYTIKKITMLGLLSALAFLAVLFFRIPIFSAFEFLKYEPKDIIICIAAFIFGPLAGLSISIVVSFIEMVTISTTGPIGLIMNILGTIAFVCPAAFIYKKRKTISSAVFGLVIGTLCMVTTILLWNYLITPLYTGMPREAISAMLIPVFLPFNLLKAGINSALILMLYKGVVTTLRKTNLLPQDPTAAKKGIKLYTGVFLVSAVVLATCILLILVFNGSL